jgi:hypothetical protein
VAFCRREESGHVVRVHPDFDPATLRKVAAALEGQPC